MCTRYFIERQMERMRAYVQDAESSPLFQRFVESGKPGIATGEIFPTDIVPVIAPDRRGKMSVFPMRWGFQVPNRSLVVNARAETAGDKLSFRDSWKEHRCIIPASYYFEWKHYIEENGKKKTGSKCSVYSETDDIMWMCGLYRIENGFPVFVVLTKDASDDVRLIHDRMPMMLPEEYISEWISPETVPETMLSEIVDKVSIKELV